jgi:hypothetical protein
MAQGTTLEDFARLAVDGDREALDSLVQALQGDIYAPCACCGTARTQKTRRKKSWSAW